MAQNDESWTGFYKWALAGTCGCILLIGGVAAGIWSKSLDRRLDDLALGQSKQWEVLNERASLPPRLGEVERQMERQREDFEARLRQIERKMWGGGQLH